MNTDHPAGREGTDPQITQMSQISELELTRQTRLNAALRFGIFILLYLCFVLLSAWVAVPLVRSLPVSSATGTMLQTVAAGLTAVLAATLLLLAGLDDRPPAYIGLGRAPGWLAELSCGFVLGAALIGVIVLVLGVSGHLRYEAGPAGVGRGALRLAAVLGIFLLGALHEELLFRGYPFQRLIEVMGAPAAVLLLAAAFGAVHSGNPHASIPGALNTALVGILFSLAYLKTARLWLPIGLHWGWNFSEGASGLPVSGITIDALPWSARVSGAEWLQGGGYGPEASLTATAVIGAAILAFLLRNSDRGATEPRP